MKLTSEPMTTIEAVIRDKNGNIKSQETTQIPTRELFLNNILANERREE